MVDFATSVRNFGTEALRGVKRVRDEAAIAVLQEASRPESAGGRMPVASGRLRDSITVNGTSGVRQISGAVEGVRLNTRIIAEWDSDYAVAVEYGANGNRPAAFARSASARWEQYIQRAAAKELRRR
ncbi:MAG: hypothetical protein K0U41_09930 [Gammaproteobacteria bacterium]|nr:hypothetical protein [Gammaproteobacteria bacterium]